MTMNKRLIFITIFSAILLMPSMLMAQDKQRPVKGWKLVWKEDFKGNSLDTNSWKRCRVGTSDWDRHMSPLDSLCQVKNGVLELWGIPTPKGLNDSRPFITGGVNSKGLRSVKKVV